MCSDYGSIDCTHAPAQTCLLIVPAQAWSIRTGQYLGVIGQGKVASSSDQFFAILSENVYIYDMVKCADV